MPNDSAWGFEPKASYTQRAYLDVQAMLTEKTKFLWVHCYVTIATDKITYEKMMWKTLEIIGQRSVVGYDLDPWL